jgi:hypothetical protein
MAAFGVFGTVYMLRQGKMLIVPILLTGILCGIFMTGRLLSRDLQATKPKSSDSETTGIDGSLWIRTLIVQKCWSYATTAGFFGYGNTIGQEELDLESVDNSYMLFVVRRGWLYLVFFLCMALAVAVNGTTMLMKHHMPSAIIPVAAAMAAILGTMAAMFTVWFGFIYAVLWISTVGLSVSLGQSLRVMAPAATPMPTRFGFDVVPAR